MLNNKQLRLRRRQGLILLMPMLAVATVATTTVEAAPNKAPICKILSPKSKTKLTANQDISFSAKATLKDKSAGPLTYEWDFAGGVFGELIPNSNPPAYKRPTNNTATVQFVRDNANYRVRFSATDTQKRRCEAAIDVVVGNPPQGLPNVAAMVSESQKNAPKLAGPRRQGRRYRGIALSRADDASPHRCSLPTRFVYSGVAWALQLVERNGLQKRSQADTNDQRNDCLKV